jgi:hypothetical protein
MAARRQLNRLALHFLLERGEELVLFAFASSSTGIGLWLGGARPRYCRRRIEREIIAALAAHQTPLRRLSYLDEEHVEAITHVALAEFRLALARIAAPLFDASAGDDLVLSLGAEEHHLATIARAAPQRG